jgi:glycosyltransferase involved in cell wall biosynthesis
VSLSDAQCEAELTAPELRDDAVLFVGSGFFANREAVAFLLNQVAPALAKRGNTRIRIAGSGFSQAEWQGDIPPNVDLLGRVPDLTTCYRQARAFVAPIFSGAGMKVKVAEALMYGLPVIGSPLALRGYLEKHRKTPHLMEAATPESFVEAIGACSNAPRSLYTSARVDFEYRFSSEAGQKRTRILMEQLLASSD